MKVELTSDFWDDGKGNVYGRGAVVDMPEAKAKIMVKSGAAREYGAPAKVVVKMDGAGEFFRLAAMALGSHHKRRAEMAAAAGAPADADADAQKAALMSPPDAGRIARVIERMQAVEKGWA